jgi:hypothetical protein
VFERFNAVGWTFRQNFNAAIRQVLYVAKNLMTGSRTLSEESIAYALHFATYQKLSRDFSCHLLLTQPSRLGQADVKAKGDLEQMHSNECDSSAQLR